MSVIRTVCAISFIMLLGFEVLGMTNIGWVKVFLPLIGLIGLELTVWGIALYFVIGKVKKQAEISEKGRSRSKFQEWIDKSLKAQGDMKNQIK